MNADFLKRLYWVCSCEEDYFETGMNLGEMYERIPDVGRAENAYSDYLNSIESTEKAKLDSFVYSISEMREMQGFLNGFRLGMKLAGELEGGANGEY